MYKTYINKKRVYLDFNRKNKWMGLIDYKTLSIIGIYISIIIFILSKINIEFIVKFYILAIFIIPICVMFILSDLKQDSVVDMFIIMIKFVFCRVIYVKENKSMYFKKAIYKI